MCASAAIAEPSATESMTAEIIGSKRATIGDRRTNGANIGTRGQSNGDNQRSDASMASCKVPPSIRSENQGVDISRHQAADERTTIEGS